MLDRKHDNMSEKSISMLFLCFLSLLMPTTVTKGDDTFSATQSLKDGETLVSAGGSFELGFFGLGSPSRRYLGIWYHDISNKTVVWVANREFPLIDSSGVLKITNLGVLTLLNGNGTLVWASSNSSRLVSNPIATLLDTGNLLVKDEVGTIWQSFDYPADTFLPEMKLGWDLETGHEWFLSSWKSDDDPSMGNFTERIDRKGYPEKVVLKNSEITYCSGPWNGLYFSGTPQVKFNPVYSYELVLNEKEIYYSNHLKNASIKSRVVIQPTGKVQRFTWNESSGWKLFLTVQKDDCDAYAQCGAYGRCNINNSPNCNCMEGFVPKNPEEWNMMDWSSGCVRTSILNCSNDGFRKYSGLRLPETRNSSFNKNLSLVECKEICAKNCSCTAYTTLDIKAGNGCLLWFDSLLNIRELADGQDIYVRMPASELEQKDNAKIETGSNWKKNVGIAFGCAIPIAILLLFICICRRKLKSGASLHQKSLAFLRTLLAIPRSSSTNGGQKDDTDLPLFDLKTIIQATNNFSDSNKVGEGGFGPVYQGTLKDGQEIAVKRLSKSSRQGLDEFKNEVVHIAKLQHRNLVKLLGCCIDEDEKMLIYEFMPNKSLDHSIFEGKKESSLLDWPNRYNVINGIARGLLYLHQDSRLRIIHRDLKVSNVLLDREMIPKISDFGLSRSFGGNESEANTKKVVGTYGYMSPEYAIDGLYSTKSDVFSFGVIVLEIVSGERNRRFCHPTHQLNLLGHAWKLFIEGKSMELAADYILGSCVPCQVECVIQVGLLCVQRNLEDRPSMSTVLLMMSSESALPKPKQPGFFLERDLGNANSSSTSPNELFSSNEVTITQLDAR